jgi:hypothetical protein
VNPMIVNTNSDIQRYTRNTAHVAVASTSTV